jgi:hypothetical protein
MAGPTKAHYPPIATLQAILSDPQRRKRLHLLTPLLWSVMLLALASLIAATHTAYPTIAGQHCDTLLHNYDYKNSLALRDGQQEMDAVQFVNGLIAGQPAALVQVTDSGPQHLLDVYVYSCTMQQQRPAIKQVFKQQGLTEGTMSITQAHTLSIGQLDTTLSPDENTVLLPLQQNIYREYSWRHGMFVPIEFPALYPVLSRSEAEALQEQANNGQKLLWSDALASAQQMAQDILQWSPGSFQTSLLDQTTTTAHVRLTRSDLHLSMTITLARLIKPDSTGLWFVTGAQTAGISLHQLQGRLPAASPLNIQERVSLHDGKMAMQLFDHTLTPMPLSNGPTIKAMPDGTYLGTLSYGGKVPQQAALLLVEDIGPAGGELALMKVTLG